MTSNTFVGQDAPDFALKSDQDKTITLDELVSNGPVLLAFYPGDFTPVCTKQLCSYQDAVGRFQNFGITLAGISKNSPEEHVKFRSRYSFTFPLLSDPKHEVTKKYGVTSLLMFGGTSRAVFIISKGKKILYRHIEKTILTHRKSEDLITALKELKEKGLL